VFNKIIGSWDPPFWGRRPEKIEPLFLSHFKPFQDFLNHFAEREKERTSWIFGHKI